MATIRNEGTCTIGDMSVKLKATWESLVAIEEQSGLDLVTLSSMFHERKLHLRLASIVIFNLAKAAGDKRTLPYFGKLLLEHGYFTPYVQAMGVLGGALIAGAKEQGAAGDANPPAAEETPE